MAPPSSRRSSRARTINSQSQQSSSASSTSSARVERNTRSGNKPSSGKSTPSASLSSEPPEDLDDTHLLRRRRRAYEDDRDKLSRQDSIEMAHGSDDIQEDDEAVRCICGYDDYPGPPPLELETKQARDQDSIIFSGLEVTDDISGFYVQCDICKVWQHGACVGIMTEESSPDEYFCEKCRKDLHKIHKASNGQRYSTYLPLHRATRASRSASVAKDGGRSPKNGATKTERQSAASQISKRRSTMNSREAAYDEEEQLRRAIEASKELAVVPDDGATRRNKRSRSDSEENTASVKRQRTSSQSPSPPADLTKAEPQDDSDDGTVTRNGSSKKARSSRPLKEKSEREERERQRQEAASKRKGRADRRRGEGPTASAPEKEAARQADVDSDPSEEIPLAATRATGNKPTIEIQPSVEPSVTTLPPPDTPPPGNGPPNSAHKKSARSTQKKTKGRNQYTKDRDGDSERSPVRSMSRDTPRRDEPNSNGAHKSDRSTSKSKTGPHSKISLTELKRRSAAFLEFIAKTQIELASEDLSESRQPDADQAQQSDRGSPPQIQLNGSSSSGAWNAEEERPRSSSSQSDTKPFKALSCVEMMDLLTRDLVKWQNRHSS